MRENTGNKGRVSLRPFVALLLLLLTAGLTVGVAFGAAPTTFPASAPVGSAPAQTNAPIGETNTQTKNGVTVGQSYKNDLSPALRDMPNVPTKGVKEHEINPNPSTRPQHQDRQDTVVQRALAPLAMPTPILNFDGMSFVSSGCNCAPPDTNGEVGATQYVQTVNQAYQVFNKATGASLLGPRSISSIWTGFGGACENGGSGDPIVLYDQVANRWLISQFATATGGTPITDECIAVSTSNDATGAYNRYGFHLGSNFFDYPHLSVWPDAYYMSDNVFNSTGTTFLGPQPFAFNRAAMLAGTAATFVSPEITNGPNEDTYLPADLDGSTLPAAGAPATFVEFPSTNTYRTFHFHADFVTPANSTFTLFASPAAAGFTTLCGTTRACVPELGGENLDGIGDRLMFRLAYRNFGSYESVVGNFTVRSGGVASIRTSHPHGYTDIQPDQHGSRHRHPVYYQVRRHTGHRTRQHVLQPDQVSRLPPHHRWLSLRWSR